MTVGGYQVLQQQALGGLPKPSADTFMTSMLMNHRAQPDTAYIRYTVTTVTTDDSPDLQPVDPLWLDVRDCRADPVYDVLGDGRRGSTDVRTVTWRPPVAGRGSFTRRLDTPGTYRLFCSLHPVAMTQRIVVR